MKRYSAPWSFSLVALSVVAGAICAGTAVLLGRDGYVWLAILPLLILVLASLFVVRGYSVGPDALLVHRLFWMTRLPLKGLETAQFEPRAMRWSLRTFGNGGLFSFTGFYRNRLLGAYRAFVTNPRRTVVLRFPSRTIVVSPAAPEDFARELLARKQAA